MGTTRLQVYNDALLLCGERSLASLEEEREPRRLLDQVWSGHGVDYCLEQGQWWFAMRTARVEVDEDFTTPDFGYQNAFSKPEDWISTSAVCSDEFFRVPLTGYSDEMGYWFANIEPLYVQFVSNDATYGGDLSLWPATFCDYAAAYFASRIISKLSGDRSAQRDTIFGPPGYPDRGLLATSLRKAKNAAAKTQPTMFPAQGNWSRSRLGRNSSRYDRGNSGSLIG